MQPKELYKIGTSRNPGALSGRLGGIQNTQGVALGWYPSALSAPKPSGISLPSSLEVV
jgi:hypothetical protein